MRPIGKAQRLAHLLDTAGVLRLLGRRGTWKGLLTLTYHRIGDGAECPGDRNLFSATQDELAEQMAFVARHADIVGAGDLHDVLQMRDGRHVAVTFDDGYRDNHDLALPVMRAHGVPAIWFVATGLIDRPRVPWWDELAWVVRVSGVAELPAHPPFTAAAVPLADRAVAAAALLGRLTALGADQVEPFLDWLGDAAGTGRATPGLAHDEWMTWEHVRALRDAGMGIGGHTVDHPILARCRPERQAQEIEGGLARLHEQLGTRPELFAHPVGDPSAYDETTRACLQAAGVRYAFAFAGGFEEAGTAPDPLALRRVYVGRDLTRAHFRARVVLPRLYARPART